jgi:hypothetical protein
MNATIVEAVPTTWVDERDVAFFRVTEGVFSPTFLAGASALLSLNAEPDDESAIRLP